MNKKLMAFVAAAAAALAACVGLAGCGGTQAASSSSTATSSSAAAQPASSAAAQSASAAAPASSAAAPASSAAAPAKIASNVGLVPQCDMKILQNVFSDPRSKVVKLYESSYLFRIAAVDIKGADGEEDYSFDDSDAVEYVVGSHADDFGEEGIPFDLVDVWAEEDLDHYDEGYDDEFGDAQMTEVNEDGSATTKPTSTNSNTTAKMGDSIGGMNGVLMAAAAAGAAMTAHSARRVANERAASDADASEADEE